ncbi:ABC transporter permease subunit [Agrobacterium tumefaciens]|uniref:ABC transmembrane type-1 domain-containing protein n=1 Tax=Pararhizobium polonicum TaxID=1612624 RepID=A0A1C7P821_9HYPH|nr:MULTISPECIES: ABC transporter permease subunit [Rhizobium/Agrobacterium group]MQB08077.1 ABC transporter permease subunit [Agrobacterium tumefaciens]NTH16484.1 ABC transporter permease subunit [Rhizobium rhizogenes]OBZ97419.1 hypothetical protein ADU59_01430 [Pararhizobium polonicum]TRB17761.1 ABC transporter permease subunit [Rhizobium rhizogenes]
MSPITQSTARRKLPVSEFLSRWPLLQIAPLLIFLTLVFVLPVGSILVLSIYDGTGALSLENFRRLFGSNLYTGVLLKTIQTASWTTGLCLLFGYPVAFALTKARANFQVALLAAVLVPLWTSFLIRSLSLVIVFGRRGVINGTAEQFGWIDTPLAFIYNWSGVMIGLTNSLLPLSIITMYSVMQAIEPNLAKAASTLGARPSHGFWRVYFPLSVPGVAAGGILTFVSALGFFITPQLLGSPRETMIAQLIIQQIDELLNWNFGAAIAVMLLAATLISFVAFELVVGMQILTGEESGRRPSGFNKAIRTGGMKLVNALSWVTAWVGIGFEKITGSKPKVADSDRRPILMIFSVATALFLSLPIFFMIPISFSDSLLFGWPPQGLSFRWYEAVIGSSVWMSAAGRSFGVALITSALAILMAVPSALYLVRQRVRGKFLMVLLLTIPIFLPHIITGVALYYTYSRYGLVGTWIGLILGHLVFSLPYATISLMAVLKNYNRSIDYAAWTLGASKFATFRHITLPIIKPGIYSAFLFAFIQSFDEVTVSLFITGGRFTTLPKQLYQQAVYGETPELAAVSTILFVTVCLVMMAARLLSKRATSF